MRARSQKPRWYHTENLFYTRALAALLSANLLSLVILNALQLPPRVLVPVYPLGAAAAWLLLRPAQVRRAPFRLHRLAVWMAAGALVLLTAPRLLYFAEWIPGAAVLAQADDYGRLAELVSMTLSERYPLVHPSNQSFLFSHYYAALFPMAWLKLAAPVLTLKDSIVLGNLLYHGLFLLSLLECAPRLVRRPSGAVLFVFLFTLFGGFDILAGHLIPFEHTEHWQRAWFGRIREISSFYTANYWTVHHMAAVWCVLLAFVFSRETRFRRRWQKPLLAGWLLVSAAASSVFVVLTLPLVAWKELYALLGRLLRSGMIAPVAAAALAPLWIYSNRVEKASLAWAPVPLAFPFYLALIFLIDLAGIPFWVAWKWPRLAAHERRWFLGSVLFLASTWAVESIGYNNYAMRGGLIPTLAILVLFARHPMPRLSLALVVLTVITTVREAATLTYWPLEFSNWYWEMRGKPVPAHVAKRLRAAYPRLARDPSTRYYQPDSGDRHGLDKFNAEKLILDLPVPEMDEGERELLRRRR